MMNGTLLTQDFLLDGIDKTENRQRVTTLEFETFRCELRTLLKNFRSHANPNEADTEKDLIHPVLRKLGWADFTTQTNMEPSGRLAPDALLFLSAAERQKAVGQEDQSKSYRFGKCIVEAKAWERPLDRASGEQGTPSSQIIRYLSRADALTDGNLLWGILTNGRYWRLYYQKARSRAEDFLEIDLLEALPLEPEEEEKEDADAAADTPVPAATPTPKADQAGQADNGRNTPERLLMLFLLLFGRSAFAPDKSGLNFLEQAREESRKWEERVAKDLSEQVFEKTFPMLVRAIAKHDPERPDDLTPAYLQQVRDGALFLLYRLLFVLNAEDRNLLPDNGGAYRHYSLTTARMRIARIRDSGNAFSPRVCMLHSNLAGIFSAIDQGDRTLGIPAYNGGLFDAAAAPILERCALPDEVLADVIFTLSHDQSGRDARYINYRDLSVQQLGSIYERILEYNVVEGDDGLTIRLNNFARKDSGSYYTPEELVHLIIERTVGPLLDDAYEAFRHHAESLKRDRRSVAFRIGLLAKHDPASAMLGLKICDPAMGSGHFLVSLVDWLADRILEAMADAETLVDWAGEDHAYRSPLAVRIDDIRSRIVTAARENEWPIVEEQLEDRHIIRRMVLKRVIYGVDKNPMAVELAKVALWLHSFTAGLPLSFLDHHLRCGDSLFGEKVLPVMVDLERRGNLLIYEYTQRAKSTATAMEQIEGLTDADITEVRTSADTFAQVEKKIRPLTNLMDFMHALRWVGPKDAEGKKALDSFFDAQFGDPLDVLTGKKQPGNHARHAKRFREILHAAREHIATHGFLHWQVTFPGVWQNWDSGEVEGGFDAVIGNPPWDRLKFQEVEWFAARQPAIAGKARAADRKKMIAALKKAHDPLADDHEKAKAASMTAAEVARECGDYPLLSGGDTNIYSLFVEQAMSLTTRNGMIGLLVPSGIASDKTAAPFFRSVATASRLKALYDFENRRPDQPQFFPDVDSRFKFCVFIAGAVQRHFDHAHCGFFLGTTDQVENEERTFQMTADDFARFNPNTGTAPVIRTRRDADITRAIYRRFPILMDRTGAEVQSVFPVKYTRMFDMTNDSQFFMTGAELTERGYPIRGNRYRMEGEDYLPLYEGKMVHIYDHRAASVKINPDNIHNAALSAETGSRRKANPDYFPTPQYWVSENAVDWPKGIDWQLAFRDTTNTTNARTMIAAVIPKNGAGNKLPILAVEKSVRNYTKNIFMLHGNLCAILFDYILRQKMHGQSLNLYILEQLPMIPPEAYRRKFGPKTAREIVREEVLALTYTAHDLAPFAKDMGYTDPQTGDVLPPFTWDDDDRLRRRAKLDALYFLLYFPDDSRDALRDLVAHIYAAFPIVEREEMKAHGHYRSRDLCLAWINALADGNPDADIDPRHPDSQP